MPISPLPLSGVFGLPPQITPGQLAIEAGGIAALIIGVVGPASTSNSAFTGAMPIRRRRSRSAFGDGAARPSPPGAAVSSAHTPR